MATVFDVFKETPYTFLEIAQSHIRGDLITAERELQGIFKDKAGQVQNGNMQAIDSSATLHIHPEDFPNVKGCADLVGQGVRVNGQDYSIHGATAGTNFENGIIEHYRLTLQKAVFVKNVI